MTESKHVRSSPPGQQLVFNITESVIFMSYKIPIEIKTYITTCKRDSISFNIFSKL